MIVTLTANPSVDRTIEVDELVRGTVLRARANRVDPGGKGVNISRALVAHRLRTLAVLPSGGVEGRQLAGLLAADGIETALVPITGAVRSNISVAEPDGTVTKLNETGPTLTSGELDAMTETVVAAARGAEWVVLAGSLPPGAPTDYYAALIKELSSLGVRIALDSSEAAFDAALGAGPDLIKPNRRELAEAAGAPVRTLGEAIAAARLLRDRGARAVLASLGADGAVLVDADGAAYGEAAAVAPRSAVGAGDAMLAGFLAAGGAGTEALAEALAWGAAAVSLPGSRMPAPADLDRAAVRIHPRADADRPLNDRS
jgi:1-phosphofructokinase